MISAAVGKSGPFDVSAEFRDARFGFVEQMDARAGHFAQVVRRDVGGHADRDAGRSVQQHVRHACRQPGRFVARAVVIRREVDRALVDFVEQQFGHRRETRFGVAHRREGFRIVGRTEVALAVDERIAVRERLGHQHHRFVAGAVAVRMVFAEHLADRERALARLGGRGKAQVVHRVDDAALYGFESVTDEGQGAVEHHVHRVVEVGALGVILERDLFEIGLQVHHRHFISRSADCDAIRGRCGRDEASPRASDIVSAWMSSARIAHTSIRIRSLSKRRFRD